MKILYNFSEKLSTANPPFQIFERGFVASVASGSFNSLIR